MSGQTKSKTYTPVEIADAWNESADEGEEIDVRTVRREIQRGHLKAQKFGSSWVVAEADAVKWLETYERYGRKK